MKDGPRAARDVWEAARRQGLSERTLQRARRERGIRSQPAWRTGRRQYSWLRRGQQLPADVVAEDAETDLEEWLAPLRERFPPGTPLDEP